MPANAGDTGSMPGPGRFHMPLSNKALCATATETRPPTGYALQQEKPPQHVACTLQLESSPRLPQLEKTLCNNKDPAQLKLNK